ncbi:hypothetical protein [Sphingomonas ginkgonis]|uniref:hypothetical protein n=1 Tax=Sphingomonas ginkgonis TaxID=2315330 RepID=UPI001639F34F|nr:hypothetical protein [Sphingomonas ginkgonis]
MAKANSSFGDVFFMAEPTQHKTGTEARAGTTPHMTRYVLVGGLVLVVVAFVLILFIAR